jgi:hypothetical protein
MLQNPKRVDREKSDAWQHSHGYCFAMGLPFVPCFFQLAQFLDAEGQAELKALIALYKQHREEIFTSYTFPIGQKPDNASWSGFQLAKPDGRGGHLLVFRELHNEQPQNALQVKFLSGKRITLRDLRKETSETITVPSSGLIDLTIDQPADYAFYQYEILQ